MPRSTLTPQQRSLRASIAANIRLASSDPVEMTAAARAASPGSVDYWLAKVDPDGTLDLAERTRRAEHAKRAHFKQLALKSARARSRRGDAA